MRIEVKVCLYSWLMLLGMSATTTFANSSDDLNKPVGQFLASCEKDPSHDSACNSVVSATRFYTEARMTSCVPDSPDGKEAYEKWERDQILAVIRWLHAHPVPADTTATNAVAKAVVSMWPGPCKY